VSPRGRRLNGTGVTPDLPIHRTIDALWKGRDEVLEAAQKMLAETPASKAASPRFTPRDSLAKVYWLDVPFRGALLALAFYAAG
jgi:C-terminal processing protease CtpA/Prc